MEERTSLHALTTLRSCHAAGALSARAAEAAGQLPTNRSAAIPQAVHGARASNRVAGTTRLRRHALPQRATAARRANGIPEAAIATRHRAGSTRIVRHARAIVAGGITTTAQTFLAITGTITRVDA